MKACAILFISFLIVSCGTSKSEIEDTWLLVSGQLIRGTDTTFTDYTQGQRVIKIINDTHFSFVRHDLHHGSDSVSIYVSGAGTYDLTGSKYTEHLEYCNYREWEDHDFEFEIVMKGDTLIQTGKEKIVELGVDQVIQEKYIRLQ